MLLKRIYVVYRHIIVIIRLDSVQLENTPQSADENRFRIPIPHPAMMIPVISMVGCLVEMYTIGVISRWIEFSWDVLSLVYRIPLQYIILCAIELYGTYLIFNSGMLSIVSYRLETRKDDELVRGRQHSVGRYSGIHQQRRQFCRRRSPAIFTAASGGNI